jgi:hypothetical protein
MKIILMALSVLLATSTTWGACPLLMGVRVRTTVVRQRVRMPPLVGVAVAPMMVAPVQTYVAPAPQVEVQEYVAPAPVIEETRVMRTYRAPMAYAHVYAAPMTTRAMTVPEYRAWRKLYNRGIVD